MELSKTIALTAIVFVVVLVLTSGRLLGADASRSREPAPRKNEAAFERIGPKQAKPAGTEYTPRKAARKQPPAPRPCQYKPVMTERDMAACRAAKRK